jgi:hypothetical protein
MRTWHLVGGLLMLAGCSFDTGEGPLPAEADIDRLEAKLAGHPCVGDLNGWERSYRYSTKTGLLTPYSLNPDLDVIELHLRRAGTVTIQAGRTTFPSASGGWPDSAAVQSIEGRYKVTARALDLSCDVQRRRRSG